jgi:hypothetical protein
LEEAGKGLLQPDIDNITGRWTALIAEIETRLSQSWLDSRCAPLSKTVRDYELKRIRAIRKASEIARIRAGTSAPAAVSGHELWVESHDGLLAGAIDSVIRTHEGVILRDYKTGLIFEGQEIKPDYELQLKLYAALYHESFGEWPVALQIEPLSGDNVDISFTHDECAALLIKAAGVLTEVNHLVSSLQGSTTLSQRISSLAQPDPKKCMYCQFRPKCGSYLRERPQQQTTGWPLDLIGRASEITRLNNGRLLLGIRMPSGIAYIRGLTDSTERHPALESLNVSDFIGVFNLLRTPADDTFSESAQTVIYKYDSDATLLTSYPT